MGPGGRCAMCISSIFPLNLATQITENKVVAFSPDRCIIEAKLNAAGGCCNIGDPFLLSSGCKNDSSSSLEYQFVKYAE
jgi:hypothetical protein